MVGCLNSCILCTRLVSVNAQAGISCRGIGLKGPMEGIAVKDRVTDQVGIMIVSYYASVVSTPGQEVDVRIDYCFHV